MTFEIIVALDSRLGIGKGGKLPWHLSGDLKHFKAITTQTKDPGKKNAVIMGRKTWESIPLPYRPLSGRVNVVLTQNAKLELPSSVLKAESFNDALELLCRLSAQQNIERIFVIGGGQVYAEALKKSACSKVHATHIQKDFQCDTFFPMFTNQFSPERTSEPQDESGLTYGFTTYRRNK